jgi:hypothetical protein
VIAPAVIAVWARVSHRAGRLLRFRRELMRELRWRDGDWYRHWPEVAALLLALLAEDR